MAKIIGSGLIASAFRNSSLSCFEKLCIIAAGVSDSSTSSQVQFSREYDLVLQTLGSHIGYKFIYFSSSALYSITKFFYALFSS